MKLLYKNSLALTIDAINEALLSEVNLAKIQKLKVAGWIASRQGLCGSYADMFAPTKMDIENGIVVFTGEKVKSRAGVSHILGQEASRMLILLNVKNKKVNIALEKATNGFLNRIKKHNVKFENGTYCCPTCTCAFWRHLSVGGLERAETIISAGLKTLKSLRDGSGRWKKFPFYYTLLSLSDMNSPDAVKEIKYALPVCEIILNRTTKTDKINRHRRMVIEKVLNSYS